MLVKYLLISSLFILIFSLLKLRFDVKAKYHKIKFKIIDLTILLFLFHLGNILISNSHPLLGATLASPGSYLTRGLLLDSNPFIRRIIEPSIWLLIICLIYYSTFIKSYFSKFLIFISIVIAIITLFLEASFIRQSFNFSLTLNNIPNPTYICLGWVSCFIISSFSFFFKNISLKKTSANIILSILIFFQIIILNIAKKTIPATENMKLKATHYYFWFPENWKSGYGDTNLENHKNPSLGEYSSEDKNIIAQQLDLMKKENINIVFLDWWPTRRQLKNRAEIFIKEIPQNSNLKYAFHFEIQDLLHSELIFDISSTKKKNLLKKHLLHIAKKYFHDPNYLTINGKKVINIYIARNIIGETTNAISEIREEIKKKTGYEIYLIADEVFYNTISGTNLKKIKLEHEYIPNWDRITSFNAITLYNPYDPTFNYGNNPIEIQKNFLLRTKKLFLEYKKISELSAIPFIPTIIPGYNDNRIRPSLNHQIIPREINDHNTLQEMLRINDEVFHDFKTNLIIMTSWNEWNEGTNIEP